MISEIYIGDSMLLKASLGREIRYIFQHATKEESGWNIHITIEMVTGYAGGMTNITWHVNVGDTLKLSPVMKGFIYDSNSSKRNIKPIKVTSIHFDDIAPDSLLVSFD